MPLLRLIPFVIAVASLAGCVAPEAPPPPKPVAAVKPAPSPNEAHFEPAPMPNNQVRGPDNSVVKVASPSKSKS